MIGPWGEIGLGIKGSHKGVLDQVFEMDVCLFIFKFKNHKDHSCTN